MFVPRFFEEVIYKFGTFGFSHHKVKLFPFPKRPVLAECSVFSSLCDVEKFARAGRGAFHKNWGYSYNLLFTSF
jgi:hypothetical protein